MYTSGPRTVGTYVNGCKAHPFLAPALVFGRDFVAKFASKKIAAAINRGVDAYKAADDFLKGAAESIRAVADGKAPKKTRLLANSINVQQRGELRYTVGTNTEYAVFQEFGTGVYGPLGRAYLLPPRMKLPPGLKRSGQGKIGGGRRKGV